MSASERVCLVGWGAIGQRVAALLHARGAACRIVGVAVRDTARPRPELPPGAALLDTPAALAGLDADLVVEAAGRSSVFPWGEASLGGGADFMVSSTSALVEPGILQRLQSIAGDTGAHILIPPGALGGMDALAAAGRLPLDGVLHRIIKPPAAWKGTAAERLCKLDDLARPTVFFKGSAAAAADAFPQNANAAIITALAGVGMDRTRMELVADPGVRLNTHEIEAEGAFGMLRIRVENRPLAANPKSSDMTALNLVRAIENRTASLVI